MLLAFGAVAFVPLKTRNIPSDLYVGECLYKCNHINLPPGFAGAAEVALQGRAVPVGEIGRGGVGGLQEIHQRLLGIARSAHRIVKQSTPSAMATCTTAAGDLTAGTASRR
jgi:hypothetical protein